MEDSPSGNFVRLYTRYERDLYRYTLSLCPNEDEARDILQDASVALWNKFDRYDSELSFPAWAFSFIKIQVCKHRDKQKKQARYFSDDIIDSLSALREEQLENLNERKKALQGCLKKLSVHQLTLLKMRYEDSVNISEISKSMSRNRDALYKTLERTRKSLHECISKRLRGLYE